MVIHSRGFMLFQCMVALVCASIGLSLLLHMHVKSLHMQNLLQAQAIALVHAASARHIQHFYTESVKGAWQESLHHELALEEMAMVWEPEGPMRLCWKGGHCWAIK